MKPRHLISILLISVGLCGCASLFMSREEKDYQSSMTKSLTEDWKAKTGGLLANNNQPAEPKLLEQSACMKGCNFEEFTLIKLNCEDCPTITALYCPTEKRYWISSAGGMAYHVESYGPFYFQPTQKMLDYEAKKIAKKNYNKSRWWYPYLKNSKCAQ